MPKIPTPAALVERAISAGRFVEDREWKQYQRYLLKHKKQYGHTSKGRTLKFDEYCARLS